MPKKNQEKKFKQKLHHQVVENKAMRIEAEATQKLPFPHPWLKNLRTFLDGLALILKNSPKHAAAGSEPKLLYLVHLQCDYNINI